MTSVDLSAFRVRMKYELVEGAIASQRPTKVFDVSGGWNASQALAGRVNPHPTIGAIHAQQKGRVRTRMRRRPFLRAIGCSASQPPRAVE